MENDLISKTDLLNALKQTITDKNPLYHTIYALIDSAYTYEQPQGEWDKQHTELLKYFVKCEKCGEEIMTSHKNYCPNCGVKIKSDLDGFGVSGY